MRTVVVCLATGAAWLLSCAGAQSTPGTGTQSGAAESEPQSFGTMTKAQKVIYMKETVVPRIGALWRSAGVKVAVEVSCDTCHGTRASVGNFEMPNPDLPRLSTADHFKKHKETKPEMTQFMIGKVVPEMARLVGKPPYNPQTHQGFGCFGCHTEDKGQ